MSLAQPSRTIVVEPVEVSATAPASSESPQRETPEPVQAPGAQGSPAHLTAGS
jgi:hypothetical protein